MSPFLKIEKVPLRKTHSFIVDLLISEHIKNNLRFLLRNLEFMYFVYEQVASLLYYLYEVRPDALTDFQ